jgi:predicted DNA-binding transcriptional regulator YafY
MKQDTRAERAARRRFRALALLHIGPHTSGELMAVLQKEGLFVAEREEPADAHQCLYQFRRDIDALRKLGCEIRFDRVSHCYSWHNSPFRLSLNSSQLSAFALLLDTFAESAMLHAADIQALLADLSGRLPPEQQKTVNTLRRAFGIDLHETTDYSDADPQTVQRIERAIEQGQRLAFRYRSPREGKEVRHVIEPRPLVFERGHVYLKGWSLEYQKELRFRLDYVLAGSAEVLPITSAPKRPAPISYRLRYELSAVIARNSVSQHFEGQEVERNEDGSVTITARTTDLFEACRTLISYREHCTVLEPPELVDQMRAVSENLYKKYHSRG